MDGYKMHRIIVEDEIYARITEGTSLKDFAWEMSKRLKGSIPQGNASVGYEFTFNGNVRNGSIALVYKEDVQGMSGFFGNICVAFSGDSEALLNFVDSIDLVLAK
jgi:hypothetical protein